MPRRSRGLAVPAPVTGWNARDPLDAMPATDAPILDNWVPDVGGVTVREGYTQHCISAAGGGIETLACYSAGSVEKLIAGGGGKLIDVTTSTPSNLGTGFSENEWQSANFSDRIFFVNGADTPQTYDNSSLAASGWTGPATVSDLIDVWVFKNRLFFAEQNSGSFWYGALNAITGALTEFPLTRLTNVGGRLIAGGTWTVDLGDGLNDLMVLVMSSGQAIIYQGSDPGSSADWNLVGIYQFGEPIGRRCLVRYGSDLLIITREGYVSVASWLRAGTEIDRESTKISHKIRGAVVAAIRANESDSGWQAYFSPRGEFIIFNVPTGNGPDPYNQHVFNIVTEAWCRFTNIPARVFGSLGGDDYFGAANGTIYKIGGQNDDGAAIQTDAQQAWSHFGSRGVRKKWNWFEPVFGTTGSLNINAEFGVDFNTLDVSSATLSSELTGAIWDVDTWDTEGDVWAGGEKIETIRQAISQMGYTGSLRLRTNTKDITVKWYSTTFGFELAGVV